MAGRGWGLKYRDSQTFVRGGWHVPTSLGVWSLGLFSSFFFLHILKQKKTKKKQAIPDLIKEKRRLRRLYNNTQDPNINSTINKLQKEIRTKINQESTISWEKFCNSISLESDPKKSWRKITNFLKPKGPRSYPMLKSVNKTAKTNPEKAQPFAESVERNFGIESHLFSKSQFDRINKFVEAHSYHFTSLDSLHDDITDTDDDSDLVADVDPDTLIRIV